MKRTYSLADIAKKLKRPRTTLADWSSQFREFIPTIGSGRSMRYTEEALEVFTLILRMKEHNEPPEMIRQQLLENFRVITIGNEKEIGKQPYLVQIEDNIEAVKNALIQLTTENAELRRELAEIRRELTEARQESAAATEQLAGRIGDVSNQLERISETLSRVETYGRKRRGFFGRIFGK